MDVALALVCLLYLLLAIDLICGFQKWQATTTQDEKKTRPRRDDTGGELRRTRSVSRTMMLLNRSLKGWEKSGGTWRIHLSSQTSDSTSDSECILRDNTQSCYCKAYGQFWRNLIQDTKITTNIVYWCLKVCEICMTKAWVETQSNRRSIDSITVRVIHRMPITNKVS